MVLIAVHGSASRLVPAERGTVRATVTVKGADRATALREATQVHARCVAEAEAWVARGAATRWSSDRVVVRSEHRYRGDGRDDEIVQIATAEVRVRFRDFDALAEWMGVVGERDAVAIDGVDWSVTADRRAEVERAVRIEAVRDATGRAEAYASAIGGSAVVLRALWEPGLRPGGGAEPSSARMLAMSKAVADIELRPSDLEVTASVTADFDVAPGADAPDPAGGVLCG